MSNTFFMKLPQKHSRADFLVNQVRGKICIQVPVSLRIFLRVADNATELSHFRNLVVRLVEHREFLLRSASCKKRKNLKRIIPSLETWENCQVGNKEGFSRRNAATVKHRIRGNLKSRQKTSTCTTKFSAVSQRRLTHCWVSSCETLSQKQ